MDRGELRIQIVPTQECAEVALNPELTRTRQFLSRTAVIVLVRIWRD